MHPYEPAGRRAFTLIELMVVVAIIVILTVLLVVAAKNVIASGKAQVARATLAQIEQALEAYQLSWSKLLLRRNSSEPARTWSTGVTGPSGSAPLPVPALPPLSFDKRGGIPVWNSFDTNSAAPIVDGGQLWPISGNLSGRPDLVYEANQCLGWALTADVGSGPFLTQTSNDTIRMGEYEFDDPMTGALTLSSAAGSGETMYPDNTGQPSTTRAKVNLVDPWGRPYLYGWEIEFRKLRNPPPTSAPKWRATFRKAWVASSGPDGQASFDDASWIRDAKLVAEDKPAISAINQDNILLP